MHFMSNNAKILRYHQEETREIHAMGLQERSRRQAMGLLNYELFRLRQQQEFFHRRCLTNAENRETERRRASD
jgi:hypothetical protein